MNKLSQSEQKVLVATTAIDRLFEKGLIFSGMKIGLGTGSTAMPAVKRLAELIDEGKIKDIKAVATSFQTTLACEELKIPVFSLSSSEIGGKLDLAIDGADEISAENHLIKGGGAAHLKEKLVEYNAEKLVIIADESKVVEDLGTVFPLPVEVIPEARLSVMQALEVLGANCKIREGVKKAGPVVTDNGNLIIDCLWDKVDGKSPVNPMLLEDEINKIVGVVENGFFTKKMPLVFIGKADGSVEER
ncbi:MAG: ribose-5-phosphate isomerase RpiA [Treponemataceae bacterium]|nr:ribose-5-phosphate isomerase RpiA [Treponemataceae bacterium]